MAAAKKSAESLPEVKLVLRTNPVVREYLRDLLRTGLHGCTEAEVAERLICESIIRRVHDRDLAELRWSRGTVVNVGKK